MAIASVIVQTILGCTERAAAEITKIPGVTIHAATPKQELVLLIEAADLDAISEAAKKVEQLPNVLGVYPAYINSEA